MFDPRRASLSTYQFRVCLNRGKIHLAGVIMRKYLRVNCLLVNVVYKTDNDMNLNGIDRGTARR